MTFPRTVTERRLTLIQQEVLDLLLRGPLDCQMKFGPGNTKRLGPIIGQFRHIYGLIITTIRYEDPDSMGRRPASCWVYSLDNDSRDKAELLLDLSEVGA